MQIGTIYSLTAKTMRILTKRGLTVTDFCDKYNCDEDALRDQLHRILHNNNSAISEAWSSIQANAKKQNGTQYGVKKVLDEADDSVKAQVSRAVESTTSNELRLKTLHRHLTKLTTAKGNLNVEYAERDREFSNCCNKLMSQANKIKEMEKQLGLAKERFGRLDTECKDAMRARDEVGAKRIKVAEQIAKTEAEIEELSTVQLYVCRDGKVAALDSPNFTMDDRGASDIFTSLIALDAYDNMRIGDLRLLAKVIAIKTNFAHKMVVTFESDELASRFTAYVAASAQSSTK